MNEGIGVLALIALAWMLVGAILSEAAPAPKIETLVGRLEGENGELTLVIEKNGRSNERLILLYASARLESEANKLGFGTMVRVKCKLAGTRGDRVFITVESISKDTE